MAGFIPFDVYGEGEDAVLFSPANGYPPGAYRQFIDHLTPRFRVLGVRHRALWPGSRPEDLAGWQDVADDTLALLRQRNIRKISAIGHSLGAVANMLAAIKEPERFEKLVLIEPVFLPPALGALNRLAPDRLKRKSPLVAVALNRRYEWDSPEEAFAHFRQKSVFARWPDESLWDFIHCGLEEIPGRAPAVTLAYPREWEARIYATVPYIWSDLPRVDWPLLGIRGEHSDTIVDSAWKKWGKMRPQDRLVMLEGAGHMIPMEKPAELARLVLDYLEASAAGKETDPDPAAAAKSLDV